MRRLLFRRRPVLLILGLLLSHPRVFQRSSRRATRQAALSIAPGMESYLVVCLVEPEPVALYDFFGVSLFQEQPVEPDRVLALRSTLEEFSGLFGQLYPSEPSFVVETFVFEHPVQFFDQGLPKCFVH